MRPSLEYVERKFDEFNVLFFGGLLPRPSFRISQARTFLGQISYRRSLSPFGRERYDSFIFKVSIRHDLAEAVVEDTIIHEMIHYWILHNQWKDTSPHGRLFREKMREINRSSGRKISVTHRLTNEEASSDTTRRGHILCIVRFRDGRRGFTVITPGSPIFAKLYESVPVVSGIVESQWLYTSDPFFNRFPHVRSLKFYHPDPVQLNPHLKGVAPLIRQGQKIVLGKRIDISI